MKVLHILFDGPDDLSARIISAQAPAAEVKVVDFPGSGLSYEALIEEIFGHDRVVSWVSDGPGA
ncbi:MAG: hypothetical protein P8Y66_08305 [Nitrospirota bacterium]